MAAEKIKTRGTMDFGGNKGSYTFAGFTNDSGDGDVLVTLKAINSLLPNPAVSYTKTVESLLTR